MEPHHHNTLDMEKPADRQGFNQLVYQIVRQIPAGQVMTYGQIAGHIPAPSTIDPLAYERIRARWVGYALADCPGDVPWHRVINQQGRASRRSGGSHNIQMALLMEEGTPMTGDRRIDLTQARWDPAAAPNPKTRAQQSKSNCKHSDLPS